MDHVRSGRIECALGTFRALSRQKRILWRELASYPLIAMTRESNIRLLFELGCERSNAALIPTYEVSHVTTALAMVEAGLGVAVLPTYAAVAARNPDVKVTPPHKPQMERNIVLIMQSGRSPSPGLQSFTSFLVKHTLASLPPSMAWTGRKPSTRAT